MTKMPIAGRKAVDLLALALVMAAALTVASAFISAAISEYDFANGLSIFFGSYTFAETAYLLALTYLLASNVTLENRQFLLVATKVLAGIIVAGTLYGVLYQVFRGESPGLALAAICIQLAPGLVAAAILPMLSRRSVSTDGGDVPK